MRQISIHTGNLSIVKGHHGSRIDPAFDEFDLMGGAGHCIGNYATNLLACNRTRLGQFYKLRACKGERHDQNS